MLRTLAYVFLSIATISLLQACSIVYDVQQDTAQEACKKIVDWNQRTECLNKNKTSYEEYEKQRKEVIKK